MCYVMNTSYLHQNFQFRFHSKFYLFWYHNQLDKLAWNDHAADGEYQPQICNSHSHIPTNNRHKNVERLKFEAKQTCSLVQTQLHQDSLQYSLGNYYSYSVKYRIYDVLVITETSLFLLRKLLKTGPSTVHVPMLNIFFWTSVNLEKAYFLTGISFNNIAQLTNVYADHWEGQHRGLFTYTMCTCLGSLLSKGQGYSSIYGCKFIL